MKSAAFNQIVYSSYAYNQKTLRALLVASASCTPTGKAELRGLIFIVDGELARVKAQLLIKSFILVTLITKN
ncbi:hypothetical protein P20495_1769 [Pseudoalteromonas sp. BSi20495]|nr:hypothetical protein P20495_1769 [Pseudoalteromonas sp. BSi20495]